MNGAIAGLHTSRGGVPKHTVESARVTALGLEGDKQKHLKFHGGPQRAVCLFSRELMDALREEGHPIAPGTTGENVLISGLDWSDIRIGSRLQLGTNVQVEITDYTAPCQQIAASFTGGDFMRISQKKRAGWSRLYARVLAEGELRVGDEARLLEER
jgi:MOSC domain-containing protein YiiM